MFKFEAHPFIKYKRLITPVGVKLVRRTGRYIIPLRRVED